MVSGMCVVRLRGVWCARVVVNDECVRARVRGEQVVVCGFRCGTHTYTQALTHPDTIPHITRTQTRTGTVTVGSLDVGTGIYKRLHNLLVSFEGSYMQRCHAWSE